MSNPTELTTNPAPNPKRRTYDSVSSNSVHKPFRSPLRANPDAINQIPKRPTSHTSAIKPSHQTAFKTPTGAPRASEWGHQYLPSTAAHSILHTPPSAAQAKASSYSTVFTIPTQATTTSTTSATPHQPHPTLAISRLRTDIDTLRQSLRLLHNHIKKHPQAPTQTSVADVNVDEELEGLIEKWRSTSRLAAEELYGTARDKVNQMGGVSGWRARDEANVDRRRMWEEEAREEERKKLDAALESDSDEDEHEGGEDEEDAQRYADGVLRYKESLGKAEKQMLKAQASESRRRAREAREEAKSEYDEITKVEAEKREEKDSMWTVSGANGDDAFTMDMMLKSMGVDLKIIGWDCEEQRWAD